MPQSDFEHRFTKAYEEFADAIFRHCYFRTSNREKAKEMMQETFMKSWEYAAKGNQIDNMKAFLYRTANNLIVDHLRRKNLRTEESLEDLQEAGFDLQGSEDATRETEKSFTEQQVTKVLGKIKEPYKSAVIMRYIDDLSPQQIASALGESVNVISVRINRGMKMLRSQIVPNG